MTTRYFSSITAEAGVHPFCGEPKYRCRVSKTLQPEIIHNSRPDVSANAGAGILVSKTKFSIGADFQAGNSIPTHNA